jgi:hypothetical protein
VCRHFAALAGSVRGPWVMATWVVGRDFASRQAQRPDTERSFVTWWMASSKGSVLE